MTTKHDYNRELASALVSAAVAIRSLRDEMSRQGIPESDRYSFEMKSIMGMTKRLGPDETIKFLCDSFEAGSYDEIFRIQMSVPNPLPFSVSAWDGSYYQFDNIDEAVSYFFTLPEDIPHHLGYDTVISGVEQWFCLLAVKDRHVEVSSLDSLAESQPDIRELYEHISSLAEPYIQPDVSVTDYGNGRYLTVSKSDIGYEYRLNIKGEDLFAGGYPHPELPTYAAEYYIHEMIFERGITPDTGMPFARVNSSEFIDMLGMPPYEGRHINLEANKRSEAIPQRETVKHLDTFNSPDMLHETWLSELAVHNEPDVSAEFVSDMAGVKDIAAVSGVSPEGHLSDEWSDDVMRMLADDLCDVIFKGEEVDSSAHEGMYRLIYDWDISNPDCINIRLGVKNAIKEYEGGTYSRLKAEEVLTQLSELPNKVPDKKYAVMDDAALYIHADNFPGEDETTVLYSAQNDVPIGKTTVLKSTDAPKVWEMTKETKGIKTPKESKRR